MDDNIEMGLEVVGGGCRAVMKFMVYKTQVIALSRRILLHDVSREIGV